MEKRDNTVDEIMKKLSDRILKFNLDDSENVELEKLNKIEKIQLAIIISRKQLEQIGELIESNRNETRPVIVEENRKELERLTMEHKAFDEMTNAAYNRYYNYLNSYIELLGSRKNIGSDNISLNVFNSLIARREILLEIGRTNADIVYLIGEEKRNRFK